MTAPTQIGARKPLAFFFLILILIAFLLSLLAMIIKFQTDHARKKHDKEPELTEQCLNQNSVAYAFLEVASGRTHLICRESDTEFYDVIYKDRGTLDGITAFRVRQVDYQGVRYYFNTIDEYVAFLEGRGDLMLPVEQFQGPFIFVWP